MKRCECFSGLSIDVFQKRKSSSVPKQETFEEVVAFLQKVPLVVNEYPPGDIPRLALALTTTGTCFHEPGTIIAAQGALPDAFYLLYDGEASVTWSGFSKGEFIEELRGSLTKFDYYAGRNIVENIPHNVSLVAGANGVTVLTLTKRQFEEFGFHRIHFPVRRITAKRYDNKDENTLGVWEEMSEVGQRNVERYLSQNQNLRSLLKEDMFKILAKKARRLVIQPSTVIYNAGDPANELYMIRRGRVELEPVPVTKANVRPNLEKGIKRRLRKQAFLQRLEEGAPADAWCRQFSGDEFARQHSGMTQCSGSSLPLPLGKHKSEFGLDSRHRSDFGESSVGEFGDISRRCSNARLTDSARQHRLGSMNDDCFLERLRTSSGAKKDALNRVRSRSVCGLAAATFLVDDTVRLREDAEGDPGRVVEVLPNEQVIVHFPLKGTFTYRPSALKFAPNTGAVTFLGQGAIIGEVSFLYNMPRMTKCSSAPGENLVVYVINRSDLQKCIEGESVRNRDKITEWADLLSEVRILSSLVQAERLELARHITGEMRFQPHERVIQKGRLRELRQWYVIAGGTAVVSKCDSVTVAVLHRGGHFGDRSLLYNGGISDVNVDAGDRGMVCLCLNADVLKRLKLIFDSIGTSGGLIDYQEPKANKSRRATAQRVVKEIDPRNLDVLSLLGEGSFASVSLVQEKGTENCYALKRVSKRRVRQVGCQKMICNERDIMSLVYNKFIIKLFLAYQDDKFVYLLQEAALGCTLEVVTDRYHAQKRYGNNPENRAWLSCVQYYAGCITLGLKHLHERHIAHRDLKPGNILLDHEGCPKIIDMGFARFVLDKTNTILGTPEFMAPEIIDFPNAHNEMVDYWALGVLIFELLNGQVPWDDDRAEGQQLLYRMRQLQKAEPEPSLPHDVPAAAASFVKKLLIPDPRRRMGAGGFDEIKAHEWFRKTFDFDSLDPECISLEVMQPPQPPVSIDRELPDEDCDDAPGSYDANDVFDNVDGDQWSCCNIRIYDGQMISADTGRGIEASAMCQCPTVVRLSIDWNAQTCCGPVHVGLTTNPNDTEDFIDGYCISIMPYTMNTEALDDSYVVPSSIMRPQPLTLAIEDHGAAAIYKFGRKIHTMSKKAFGQHVKVYAKVFMNDNGDRVTVNAYKEFPDDQSNWAAAFKPLDSLRRLPQCVDGMEHRISRRRSTRNKKKGREVDHDMISSLLGLLAGVEHRDGHEGLKQAVQVAYASVEQCLEKPVPSELEGTSTPILDAALAEFKDKQNNASRSLSPMSAKSPKSGAVSRGRSPGKKVTLRLEGLEGVDSVVEPASPLNLAAQGSLPPTLSPVLRGSMKDFLCAAPSAAVPPSSAAEHPWTDASGEFAGAPIPIFGKAAPIPIFGKVETPPACAEVPELIELAQTRDTSKEWDLPTLSASSYEPPPLFPNSTHDSQKPAGILAQGTLIEAQSLARRESKTSHRASSRSSLGSGPPSAPSSFSEPTPQAPKITSLLKKAGWGDHKCEWRCF